MTRARKGMLPTPTTRPNNHRSGHDAQGKSDRGETLLQATRRLPTPTAADSDRTSETFKAINRMRDLGTLPTPQASDAKRQTLNMTARAHSDSSLTETLSRLQKRGTLPTPTTQDARASGVAGNWTKLSGRHAGATLTDVAVRGLDTSTNRSTASTKGEPTGVGGGRLSQRFVSWMMGLPIGWTEI